MRWDPEQYALFGAERSRPFHDLLARVPATSPREVVDLGCGLGDLTATLAVRWPGAHVIGIDSSPEMVDAARAGEDLRGPARSDVSSPRGSSPAGDPGTVTFQQADLRVWRPSEQTDVVVSNAALQWVPDHLGLIRDWLAELPSRASIAWQVPSNLDEPVHRIMRQIANEPRWRHQLLGIARTPVPEPEVYARLLVESGWSADVWRTTYVHVLTGPDPVLEWIRGTGLRPILQALAPDDAAAFERAYRQRLREAYPQRAGVTLLPFPRTLAVGVRP